MKETITKSKLFGLSVFGIIYIVSYILGFFAGTLSGVPLLKLFIFDLTATVIIWAVSLFLRNSSLYDPYWSLTPAVMVIYAVTLYYKTLNVYHYIFLAAFMLWSVRLTANWVITFDNLTWEDWRYRKYRELPAPLWHLANFFGIMMIPTLFVFAGFVPVFYFLSQSASPLSLVGSVAVLTGTSLEFIADRQMHRFLRNVKERKTCREGLWKYSRHPNYLGEITVWVGAYLALVASQPSRWYLFAGVALMIFLFNVISIPLAEKHHLSRRGDYAEYRNTTSALLLLPNKK